MRQPAPCKTRDDPTVIVSPLIPKDTQTIVFLLEDARCLGHLFYRAHEAPFIIRMNVFKER